LKPEKFEFAHFTGNFFIPESPGKHPGNTTTCLNFNPLRQFQESYEARNGRDLLAGFSENQSFNLLRAIKDPELSGLLHIQWI
jgi:hypothetical protein